MQESESREGGMRRRERREVFSIKMETGKRTYFFDVKKNSEGSLYLVISELNDRDERNRVMIFEENAAEFQQGVDKAVGYILEHNRTDKEA